MKVPFLDYPKLYTAYKPAVDVAMRDALKNGRLILQKDVEEFEKSFAEFLGVTHFIGLASGTDALLLALVAAGVGPGDEVITVSHTFIATIQVIHHLGATPVLVDVGEDGLMDMEQVISKLTPETKAIIPVHLSGDVCDMSPLIQLGSTNFSHVKIIEDAAQAIGAKGVGGSFAQCFSFYPAKVLGTFGDAGALATNDQAAADRVRSLRNHGDIGKEIHETYEYGLNSRMDNVWAAVLQEKLKVLPKDLKRREMIATIYSAELSDLPIKLPIMRRGRIWQDYVIRTEHRDALSVFLKDKGVGTLGAFALPNHKYPGLNLDHFTLPKTDEWFATSLRIPCNQFMTMKETYYVINRIKEFYA